ncbi:hypothetical protein ACFO5X_24675 [Seohaeicola nanhaiensis]|uniref:DUF3630 family protein n=1 Tax=Seohaeicola nanhaiensis TaxID=1387282 RepID=A0ABV9KP24_9RHOB
MPDAWAGIECDWKKEPLPSAEALATAARLVRAARIAGFPPETAQTGYWATVCLFWDSGRIEVEVFPESFELYVFATNAAGGRFSVAEFEANAPGALDALLSELSSVRQTGSE